MRITVETIKALRNEDGLTLKRYESITYKSGWQVATAGMECKTPEAAMIAVSEYNGDCGIWYSEGIYYVDKSRRVDTRREALQIGREHNQISILGWKKMELVYC